MNNKNLIIFQFKFLYQVLIELDQDLDFEIIEISNRESLNFKIKNLNNYIIITQKNLGINNQFIFNQLPIKIFKLVEKLNVELLKQQFNNQSQININNYVMNLNSREISSNGAKMKLTEKEINTLIYLSKVKKPITINELQTNVWGYQTDLETHTVETHIYRLRKKFFKVFKDENFIVSKKDGYQIK